MTQSELGRFKMDHKLEYIIFLDLLARAINVNRGFSINDIIDGERLWEAHNLANKFIDHAVTVLYLLHSTKVQDIPSFKFRFVDTASIDVLTRATFEAFLVFHYVFYAPKTKEEKDYRYWAYKAAGIAERQNLPESIFEHERQKAEEKMVLDELHDKLKSNAVFQNLAGEHKKSILKGRWRLSSWHDIAIDAGLSEILASHMYRHLSGYAHSSSLSVLQTKQAVMNKGQEQLVQSSIATMNVFIANMIREYCGLFSKAQDVLDTEPAGNKEMIEAWIEIGRRLDENLDIGQEND